jgi:hypothetical protein
VFLPSQGRSDKIMDCVLDHFFLALLWLGKEISGEEKHFKVLEKYLRKCRLQKQYPLVILTCRKASQGNKK